MSSRLASPMIHDLIILGGGCAGLSLGMQLASDPGSLSSVLILEERSRYSHDRTWCYWGFDETHRWPIKPDHSWKKLVVSKGITKSWIESPIIPYHMIKSDSFYARAETMIRDQNIVKLVMSTRVLASSWIDDNVFHIETSSGPHQARFVVDTRPSSERSPKKGHLWQVFLGDEIETGTDCFDPSAVTLMDFIAPSPYPVEFIYLLPLSPRRALIEQTVFSRKPLNPLDLKDRLRTSIRHKLGDITYDTIRTEQGVIPMGIPSRSPIKPSPWVNCSLSSGTARASTGYAFSRIQNWSQHCANTLRKGLAPLPPSLDSGVIRKMDTLLLKIIEAHPTEAPNLFIRLFQKTRTDRLIRFLGDRALPMDILEIMKAMPSGLFLGRMIKDQLASLSSRRDER